MTSIDPRPLPAGPPSAWWRAWAADAQRWLDAQRVQTADAVVLVPFAELIAPAQRAWAAQSAWLPRIHTTRTLATALGPPVPRGAGEVTGDAAIDRVTARESVRGQRWAQAWLQRDPRGFDAALQRVVHTAHVLQRHAAALSPANRADWWVQARALTGAGSGPGALQRSLLRLAIDWAALCTAADSDRLFAHRPAAWIALSCGGDDPLALHLLRDAAARGVPTQAWSADPAADDPLGDPAVSDARSTFTACVADDAEAEAIAAAAQVERCVREGRVPLALVVQDRALVRRVRALLERLPLDVADETGWALATTSAGAQAMAALRAARAIEPGDDALDWLKAGSTADTDTDALAVLEKIWRGQRIPRAARAAADALWQRERARLHAFVDPGPRALGRWQQALDTLLFASPQGELWRHDAAGVQLRRALRLGDAECGGPAWAAAAAAPMDLADFTRWVEAVLDESSFVPPSPTRSAPVVITPLSRAIGRDFAAAVMPGADELRLGPLPEDPGLLDEAVRHALGLPTRSARQHRAELAFAHLLRLPQVTVLRRRADGDELLSASRWVERVLQRLGHTEQAVELPLRELQAAPVRPPQPQVRQQLPASWSASAVEALRACPYRFFSRAVLQLSEPDELDDDADKRDAGRWLHDTLEHFHTARAQRRSPSDDATELLAAGHEALQRLAREQRVSPEALLPFSAAWPALAQRYVQWLHGEEDKGWSFRDAELRIEMPPAADTALRLHGRIDRIDTLADGSAVRLIDYKLQSRTALRSKLRQPLEDTQLAVYAALEMARSNRNVQACYLALDEPRAVVAVEHPQVQRTAQALLHQLAHERARIEAGAPLPALGEGAVCDTCEARGLCRRDHWVAPATDAPTDFSSGH